MNIAQLFETQIAVALGKQASPEIAVSQTEAGALPSAFHVSELAFASVSAAARELAAVTTAQSVEINRRLALLWFGMTLRPLGWTLPSAWDPIAGDYQCADGWIRLHTNAPHHRDAALAVLKCPEERAAVGAAVLGWEKVRLQEAVVARGGCAAAMLSVAEWAEHPQGRAVHDEPLIAWDTVRDQDSPVSMTLRGLRVLDLTRVLAGPVATRFLAGFGADVLRIDPPGWNEPGVEPEVTLGKRCASLDLHKADDRRVFERLLQQADLLVHGYRPGALDRLGYDVETRRSLNPWLIEVSLCAYGWTGPWAERRGFDSLVQMSSGIAAEGMKRAGSERPQPLPVQALDHATGYLMAAAALRALRVRRSEGRILSARLSLARTAAMLVAGGAQQSDTPMPAEAETDLSPEIEETGWGPARRINFPVRLDEYQAAWGYAAAPLRAFRAEW